MTLAAATNLEGRHKVSDELLAISGILSRDAESLSGVSSVTRGSHRQALGVKMEKRCCAKRASRQVGLAHQAGVKEGGKKCSLCSETGL
jgi:hypothetical protein